MSTEEPPAPAAKEKVVSILVTALVGFLESRRAGLPGPPREHLSTALQLISEWWPTVLASEGPAVFVRTAVLASNFVLVLSWQPSHSLPRQGEQWSTVSVLTLPKKLWSTSPDGPQFLVEHCTKGL